VLLNLKFKGLSNINFNHFYCRAVARLGEHDLSTDTEAQHIDIEVRDKIRYPQYDKKDGHGDVAILVLRNDIPFSGKFLYIYSM
jgi:hypothetical protein